MNIAIIAAAGQGKRMDGRQAKQFLELAGTPILIHTLKRLEQCADIHETVVVLPASVVGDFSEIAASYDFHKPVRGVAGGATRGESVWLGLQSVEPVTAEIIAVHDGVRPFVTPQEISQTIGKARESGAAILVAPATDTIKQVRDGRVECTLDRSQLRRALTPQSFRYELLRRAYEQAPNNGKDATDCSVLVEALGVTISIVEGDSRNIKITRPEDLAYGEILLRQYSGLRNQDTD